MEKNKFNREDFKATKLSDVSNFDRETKKEKRIYEDYIHNIIYTLNYPIDLFNPIVKELEKNKEQLTEFIFELVKEIINKIDNSFGLWDDYNQELNLHYNYKIDFLSNNLEILEQEEYPEEQATEHWIERRLKELIELSKVIKGLYGSNSSEFTKEHIKKLLSTIKKIEKSKKHISIKAKDRLRILYECKKNPKEIIDKLFHFFVDNKLLKDNIYSVYDLTNEEISSFKANPVTKEQQFKDWFLRGNKVCPIIVEMQMNQLVYLFDEMIKKKIFSNYGTFPIVERMFVVNNPNIKNFGYRRVQSENTSDHREKTKEDNVEFNFIKSFVDSI